MLRENPDAAPVKIQALVPPRLQVVALVAAGFIVAELTPKVVVPAGTVTETVVVIFPAGILKLGALPPQVTAVFAVSVPLTAVLV
jgi:hypothetical protein